MIEPRTIPQADVHRLIGRKVLEDAIAAKWVAPRAIKPGKGKPARVIYAVTDIRDIENRILAGEYPGAHPANVISNLPNAWKPK